MSKILEPRQTEAGSQYRWLKGGLRLLGRSSASWLLIWLVWAVAVVMLSTDYAVLAVPLMGISMITFDLHTLVFDQVASAKPRLLQVFPLFWAMLRKNAVLYLKVFLLRMVLVSLLIMFTYGTFLLLQHYFGVSSSPSPSSSGMFGLQWSVWTYAWFLPALFQRGGLISMRSWLIRRHGLSEEHASALQLMSIFRNSKQILSFQRWLLFPSLLCVFFFPILLPVMELAWVACMRCMYKDLFEGGLGIEEQKQEAAAPARQVVLLPVSR